MTARPPGDVEQGGDRGSVGLPAGLCAYLDLVADLEGVTVTELVERVMGRYLKRSQRRLVPDGAQVVAGRWWCRLRRHRGLEWTEETERSPTGGSRTRLVAVDCAVCGRPQRRVRAVYPPNETIRVPPPSPQGGPGSESRP